MAQLTLWFTGDTDLALDRTCFSVIQGNQERRAIRGKTAGAFPGYETFQWTLAVQSMAILALRTAALRAEGPESQGILLGTSGSPASALDYAISKGPRWLHDVFGSDVAGNAMAKRLFRRTNPERKRPGPVAIRINDYLLAPSHIEIIINNASVTDKALLMRAADEIERCFYTRIEKVQSVSSGVPQMDEAA